MSTPARYEHIDLTAPQGVIEQLRVGIRHAEDKGDGLEDATLREAHFIVDEGRATWDKATKLIAFWDRNARFLDAEEGTPAWASAKLWGGPAGYDWSRALKRQKDAADRQAKENAMPTPKDIVRLGAADIRRIKMFGWGEVRHPKGDFTVDQEFYAKLREHFEDMVARGYFIPVARQHTDDGMTYGRVVGLHATDEGVEADVEFARGMAELFDDGYLNNWSPSFYTKFSDPHTGKVYDVALREFSFVTVSHQKNLPSASPHYAMSDEGYVYITHRPDGAPPTKESRMTTANETAPVNNAEGGDEEKQKDMGSRMDAMEREMRELKASLKPMMEYMEKEMGDDEDKEMGDDEPSENGEQLAAFARRVGELERENARLDITRRLGEGVGPERLKRLSALRLKDRELYEDTICALADAQAAPVTPEPTPLAEERGNAAPRATATGRSKVEQAVRSAKDAGIKLGCGAYFEHLEAKGVKLDDLDPTIEHRVYLA